MQIIEPSYDIMFITPNPLQLLELAGRTCYKSEDKITQDSAQKFCKNILVKQHESVIEHASMTVRFICDRGVSHELVRARIASYSQESTRYCNYSKKNEITVIEPLFFSQKSYVLWHEACLYAEQQYMRLIEAGATPQEARTVLPNSLKTEIVMTANFREWRNVFKQRTSKAAHPQMRQIMIPLLRDVQTRVPVIFDDILIEG